MAVTETPETVIPDDGPSETSSWETEALEAEQTRKPDTTPDDPKVCPECGEPITRAPGARGRLPKYHPGCRPSKTGVSGGSSGTRGSTRKPSTKAENEAEALAEKFRQVLNKAAILAGTVDPFDGYAIVVQSKPMSGHFKSVLLEYPQLRKRLSETSSSGGVMGMVLCALMIAGPILAHHGIIPEKVGGKPVGETLIKLPELLQAFGAKVDEAESELAESFREGKAPESE